MNYEHMTAPCGLACFDCVVFLANENQKLRVLLSRQLGIPEEKVGCKGCRELKGDCPILPMKCTVFPCAEERGVKFCFECSDFPCDSLHPYADQANRLPHNIKMFNLCLIRKMGIEKWATEKARKIKEVYFKDKWKL